MGNQNINPQQSSRIWCPSSGILSALHFDLGTNLWVSLPRTACKKTNDQIFNAELQLPFCTGKVTEASRVTTALSTYSIMTQSSVPRFSLRTFAMSSRSYSATSNWLYSRQMNSTWTSAGSRQTTTLPARVSQWWCYLNLLFQGFWQGFVACPSNCLTRLWIWSYYSFIGRDLLPG